MVWEINREGTVLAIGSSWQIIHLQVIEEASVFFLGGGACQAGKERFGGRVPTCTKCLSSLDCWLRRAGKILEGQVESGLLQSKLVSSPGCLVTRSPVTGSVSH